MFNRYLISKVSWINVFRVFLTRLQWIRYNIHQVIHIWNAHHEHIFRKKSILFRVGYSFIYFSFFFSQWSLKFYSTNWYHKTKFIEKQEHCISLQYSCFFVCWRRNWKKKENLILNSIKWKTGFCGVGIEPICICFSIYFWLKMFFVL